MNILESAAILDVAEKGNMKNHFSSDCCCKECFISDGKTNEIGCDRRNGFKRKIEDDKKHKNKGPKSSEHKEMCPGCSWCCIGEKEPIYPGFEKKPKGRDGEKVDESKANGMVDIGAWEEKHVPGAKEYYKEIDVNIKNRIWVDKTPASQKWGKNGCGQSKVVLGSAPQNPQERGS